MRQSYEFGRIQAPEVGDELETDHVGRIQNMMTAGIELLTGEERELLTRSFHPERLRRRIRRVLLSAIVVVGAVVAFGYVGLTVAWFGAAAIIILIVSAVEKITYHRTMQTYESLIVKLTHRIEDLEGQARTPQHAGPTRVRPDRSAALSMG